MDTENHLFLLVILTRRGTSVEGLFFTESDTVSVNQNMMTAPKGEVVTSYKLPDL